ncbi:MAG: hypothetical protein IKO93_10410, partial [Lentisphaeria bacterium]|nr:hypothetical protein [Lentisphaeria bacterium]
SETSDQRRRSRKKGMAECRELPRTLSDWSDTAQYKTWRGCPGRYFDFRLRRINLSIHPCGKAETDY